MQECRFCGGDFHCEKGIRQSPSFCVTVPFHFAPQFSSSIFECTLLHDLFCSIALSRLWHWVDVFVKIVAQMGPVFWGPGSIFTAMATRKSRLTTRATESLRLSRSRSCAGPHFISPYKTGSGAHRAGSVVAPIGIAQGNHCE